MNRITLSTMVVAMFLLAAQPARATFNDNVDTDARAIRQARQEAAENYEYQKATKESARQESEDVVHIRVARPGQLPGPGWTATERITLASEQYHQVEGRLRDHHVADYQQGRVDADGLVAAVLRDASEATTAAGGGGRRSLVTPAILLAILALSCYLIFSRMDAMPVVLRRIRTHRIEREKIYDVTRSP